jgi:hypothetical protein
MIALYRAWLALTRMDLDLFITDRNRTRLTIRATRNEGLTVMLARDPHSDGAA